MNRYAGVRKIVRFNWPWYALALVVTLLSFALQFLLPGPWSGLVLGGLLMADFWLLGSLLISHYIYDRSPVQAKVWLQDIDPHHRVLLILHAGHDETSEAARIALPAAAIQTLEFCGHELVETPSLRRARALSQRQDPVIRCNKIPLPEASTDLILLVFAAHELRRPDDRRKFFSELHRILVPKGRLFLVEHLRDAWNIGAYGPGAWHFYPRRLWLQTMAAAGLTVIQERSLTPFVRYFQCGRNP